MYQNIWSRFGHAPKRPPLSQWKTLIGYSKDITNKSPTHRFPIKEVARQSGLSTATIARAINNRGNVSPKPRHGLPPLIPSLKEKKCN